MTDKDKPREITLKMLEDVAKEVFKDQVIYPRDCGNGLYELAKGVYGNRKALEEYYKQLGLVFKNFKNGEGKDICDNSGRSNKESD